MQNDCSDTCISHFVSLCCHFVSLFFCGLLYLCGWFSLFWALMRHSVSLQFFINFEFGTHRVFPCICLASFIYFPLFLVILLLYMVVFCVWVSLCVSFGLLVVLVSVFVLVPCLVVFLHYFEYFCNTFFFSSWSYVGEMWARHTLQGLSQKLSMMIGWTLQQDTEVKHIKDYCSSCSPDNVDM